MPISANSGSGDVTVKSASSAVNANTGSGDVLVQIEHEKVNSINANTGSGDVEVRIAGVGESFNANTGSGDVTAVILDPHSPGNASFNTGSGDVLLMIPTGIVGTFELETSTGDIEVPPELGIVVEEKPDGGYRGTGTVGNGGKFRLNTGAGDLDIRFGDTPPKSTH